MLKQNSAELGCVSPHACKSTLAEGCVTLQALQEYAGHSTAFLKLGLSAPPYACAQQGRVACQQKLTWPEQG